MSDEGSSVSLGTAVGGCILEEVLGHGGMGVVYRAREYALRRTVAIKIIDPIVAADSEMRERFMREAETAAAIEHPHVLPIYAIGHEEHGLFISMRYIESGDLERLADERILNDAEVAILVEQVGSALDAAHAAGLVHRDVKPQNILVDTSGDGLHSYLTDFGLARRVDDVGLSFPGAVLGTPWYMSPEQALGHSVDLRTDVYALGCVLYRLLTGAVPFDESEMTSVLLAHQMGPIPRVTTIRADLPTEVDVVIERALAKDREARFSSAGELAAAATPALVGAGRVSGGAVDAGGESVSRAVFPEPTRDYIHSQCPRMTPERFEAFLEFLRARGWTNRDIKSIVHPWAPRQWRSGSDR